MPIENTLILDKPVLMTRINEKFLIPWLRGRSPLTIDIRVEFVWIASNDFQLCV